MQENDTSMKGSAPAPKPTKYRLACDNCQQSKIRCDQERPKCHRCAKKGMKCVYSPAKRAGRPRTRNNSKYSTDSEPSASGSQKLYSTPVKESHIMISAADWISSSATDNCSNSSSSSNTSAFLSLVQTFQVPSPEDLDFSLYQQSNEDFLRTLPDFTGSQCGTPKHSIDFYYPTSPSFCIAPEPFNPNFRGTWNQSEQQEQQQSHEQYERDSTIMLLDEGLPYFGVITSENLHPINYPEEPEIMSISYVNNNHSTEGCDQLIPLMQQEQFHFTQFWEQASLSSGSCKCVSTLLAHLPTSSHPPTSSSLDSISAALSTSRVLISNCCTAVACPNACLTRPSAALAICEAIDRALISLKLSSTSLWNYTQVPVSNHENGTCSPASSSSSSTSTLFRKSRGHENGIMLLSSSGDEEHEPLRWGSLPMRGADRRAVVRLMLVKKVLEVQGVLERLRDTLWSGSLIGGDVAVKKPLLTLCADVVGEFAVKAAERVETAKLQM